MKTTKRKIVLSMLSVAMALCVLTFGTLFAVKASAVDAPTGTPTLTIESNNISYADSIHILYAVSNSGFDRTRHEIKMLFWDEIQEEYVLGTEKYASTSEGAATVNGKNCLIFYSDGLAAKQMTQDIYCRACVEIDGNAYYSETMKFSVLDYVYTQKEKGGLTTTQINLYTNLLNYGASAQYQFNYKVDRIANGDYFSITVINGKLPDGFATGRYKNNAKIKVKAENAPDGMKFSHWEDENGIIISYDKHVEITLKGNKTYRAVYKDISSVATQLVLNAEIPYNGKLDDIDLPTAVSFEVGGETVTLDVTWNTDSFISEKVGEQTLVATLVDQSAYKKYDIEVGGIVMKVKTLPYTYEIDTSTGNYILTGYYGEDKEITLPTSYRNTFITTIRAKAFDRCLSLENVVIPNTYTKIESAAFFYCDNIEKMTVPFVGETASSSNSWFGYIFGAESYSVQYGFLPLAFNEVTLAEGATKVPNYAFYKCSQIEKFNIANSIKSIQLESFAYCTSLTEFTLPEGLKSFSRAFEGCTNLKKINVSNVDMLFRLGTSSWGGNAPSPFAHGADLYCQGQLVTEISVPTGMTEVNEMFANCTSIKKIFVPASVGCVLNSFRGMTNLETVIFEEGSKISGYNGLNNTFSGCTNLKYIDLRPLTSMTEMHWTFSNCTSLKTVLLPDNVTVIGNNTFWKTAIEEIILPDSLQSIGNSAFANTELKQVVLPDGVVSIEAQAFRDCSNLVKVSLSVGLVSIGSYSFDNCSKLTEITLPERVYNIDAYAFNKCKNLSNVTILSERLTTIGSSAFSDCKRLWEIYNLSSLEFTIGADDFGGIAKYAKVIHTSLDEPSFVHVDKDGFITYSDGAENVLYGYVGNDATLTLPKNINGGNYSIYRETFKNNRIIVSVTIPDSVTEIAWDAFYGCDKLVEVINHSSLNITVGSSDYGYVACCAKVVHTGESEIVNVNDYLFYIYEGLNYLLGYIGNDTELVLPDSYNGENYEIYQYAFYENDSLTSITIPDSVTSIGEKAFNGCNLMEEEDGIYYVDKWVVLVAYNIKDAILREDTVGIAYHAFDNSSNTLVSIKLPDSLVTIGDRAFFSCSKLTSITIPDSVTSIGNSAFSYCADLTSIIIPDSVTSIGSSAFYDCTGLTSIIIPDSVTSIGEFAFFGCTGLTSVIIGDSVTSIGSQTFYGCTALINLVIGDSVAEIGGHAFGDCRELNSVIIGIGITKIGNYAFDVCRKLTSVYYKGTADEWSAIQIGDDYYLKKAVCYYYSEQEPALNAEGTAFDNNYWHYVDGVIAPWVFHKHTYTSVVTAPSCTEKGYTTHTCACGDTYIDTYVEALGHNEVVQEAVAPTCTAPGMTEGKQCSRCNEILVAQSTVDALGHTEVIDSAVAPTCTKNGLTEGKHCSVCNEVFVAQTVLPANGHTEVILEAVEASCTVSGVTEGKYCSVCNKILVAQQELGEWHDQSSNPCYICDKKYETSYSYFDIYYQTCSQKYDVSLPRFVVVPSEYQGSSIISCMMPYGTDIETVEFSEGLTTLSRCILYGETSSARYIVLPKSLETINWGAFEICTSLEAVFYAGSESDWANVYVDYSYNDALTNSKLYFYSESQPTSDGNFWHYNERGEVEIWIEETPTSYFKFTLFNGSYYVVSAADVNHMPEHVIIPSMYNGKPVQEITSSAFAGCESIKTIVVPKSVQYIGAYAFEYCTSLTSVILSEGLVCIENGAFMGCSNLIKLNIPESVSEIQQYAFNGTKLLSHDSGIYYVGKWAVASASDISNITLREGTVGLSKGLFSSRQSVGNVTIPSTVKRISDSAFYNCTGLETVIISEGVEYIGAYAFQDCSALKNISYPTSLKDVSRYAFTGCNSLLTVEGGVTYAGAWAIDYDESTANVVLKDGTLGISEYTFYYSDKLLSIDIPASLKAIGSNAFYCCTKLSSITLPEGLLHLGTYAFDSCEALTKIEIPSTVTVISDCAFIYCTSLATVVLHDDITFIGRQAFYGCSNLAYIELPESLTYIGYAAFMDCRALTRITIPCGVTSLSSQAFDSCKIVAIVLPNTLTSIDSSAFNWCKNLTSVYYTGTESEWDEISIGNNNTYLTVATRYYYSETEPVTEGNYWHYVDGVPTAW